MNKFRPPLPHLFLDRDGTLIVEEHYLKDPEKVTIEMGVVPGLKRFISSGFRLVVLSNQSGIGRGLMTFEEVDKVNARIAELLEAQGITIASWHYCPHRPGEKCRCRKPGTGMFETADGVWPVDWCNSIMIGDKPADLDAGLALRITSALVLTGYGKDNESWARSKNCLVATSIAHLADLLELP